MDQHPPSITAMGHPDAHTAAEDARGCQTARDSAKPSAEPEGRAVPRAPYLESVC